MTSDSVLTLTPTATFADCPQLDVICVPGGVGTDDMINDTDMLDFLRRQAAGAKYITSVCTGSLVLGAAGLLRGYRAATHWTAMDFLEAFGAIPTRTRVCIDRNRVTGGGVTAGIDFALTLVSILVDRKTAEAIQLRLEYNPAPPFNSGSPDTAPPEILALIKEKIAPAQARRTEADPSRRRAAGQRRSGGMTAFDRNVRRSTEKGRPVSRTAFPVLRQLHIDGRFQAFNTGGLSPGHILIGSRCISGQSRTVARTDAMVSHLRKMID